MKKYLVAIYEKPIEQEVYAETPEEAEDKAIRLNFFSDSNVAYTKASIECTDEDCGYHNDVDAEECEDCGKKLACNHNYRAHEESREKRCTECGFITKEY